MIELRPATLETVKPLRLRALREDPDAFGSTLAEEQGRPDVDWDFWVRDSLIAVDCDTPVGMISVHVDETEAGVFGMWVAPEVRGRGIGQRLVAAAIQRAGHRPITLCVAEPAAAARRLYERLGFEPTGTTGTLRPGSTIRTLDLTRAPARPRRATPR
jgi:ribosomal protein S18 acetylase RimI-like enzyme